MVTAEITLAQACTIISAHKGWNEAELLRFSSAYDGGGRDTGRWGSDAIHYIEAQLLYGMVRYIRPSIAIEVGTSSGGSATAILTAMRDNAHGELHSYDLNPNAGEKVIGYGRWHFHAGNFLDDDLLIPSADFAFEDGAHDYAFAYSALKRLKHVPHVMSHDACSDERYPDFGVWQAFNQVFPNALRLKLAGAFTGLAVSV